MGYLAKVCMIFMSLVLLNIIGCVKYSQPFIGRGGDVKNCAGSSQSQGIGGVILASNRFNECVTDLKSSGYIEVENVGSVGVLFYNPDERGLVVKKVYENSPAAYIGIVRGDILVEANGKNASNLSNINFYQGAPNIPVDVIINRNGKILKYTLIRAAIHYSNVLEDIVF